MKRVLILLILLISSHDSEATNVECVDHFLLPNLNLSYCSSYCYRADMEMLYYKGLAEALDTYVDRRREEGTLQGKKLEIQIDLIDGGPVTSLSQGPNGYYVFFGPGAVISLRQLIRIVDYFTFRNWRSFCPGYPHETALRTLNRTLDREVGQPDMTFFAGWHAVVFELDDLQIIYEDDRLFYVLAGRRLDLEPGDPTPVKVGDRYLFGSKGAIHVYENGSEILRKSLEKRFLAHGPGPLRAKAFRRWVNVRYSGGPQLSYSYKWNRFYEVPPGAWKGSDDFGGCGGVHTAPLPAAQVPGSSLRLGRR